MLQVVFEQLRLVVAAHQSVLVSLRSSADKHAIEVHLYSMPDVWSKVQAAVSRSVSGILCDHGTYISVQYEFMLGFNYLPSLYSTVQYYIVSSFFQMPVVP